MQRQLLQALEPLVTMTGAAFGRRPRLGRLRSGAGAGRFGHSEWAALLSRFVHDGAVEYGTMTRVQRLAQAYLSRLAEADPETFADVDDQLAFWLNAANAIAVYEVIQHYPIGSLRDVPGALLRPYPIGRRNVSITTLHANELRAFGDPRVHLALTRAAQGDPRLPSTPFLGTTLQTQLDQIMRDVLADPVRGLRYDPADQTLWLAPVLLRWAGDFVDPAAMPGVAHLIGNRFAPRRLLRALAPFLPAGLPDLVDASLVIRPLPFSWRLNERRAVASGRAISAL